VGIGSTARDITELKALEAQLTRMGRLQGLATLAGGIAHQFNNINTIIGGYLELMRSAKELPARLASYAEAASAGVRRATVITDRLLALTGHGAALSNTVRLHVLARTVLSRYQDRIRDEEVKLALNLVETPPVSCDEPRLTFVLSSIIDNALDSLLERPLHEISVRTGSDRESAFFEVEDSGCGMSEEDLATIFSPFSTMKGEWAPPASPQARQPGVGLSLAICNTIVLEHAGTIEVRSTKGAGATFRVTLPCAGPGLRGA